MDCYNKYQTKQYTSELAHGSVHSQRMVASTPRTTSRAYDLSPHYICNFASYEIIIVLINQKLMNQTFTQTAYQLVQTSKHKLPNIDTLPRYAFL